MTTEAPQQPQYRMPAEWAPHAATWLAWPHNPEDWPGKFQPIPWVYAEIIRWLSSVEDVHLLVNDWATEQKATRMARRQGANLARLHFHRWRTDRVWLRDSGPIFVKRFGDAAGGQVSDLAITNWRFNAWAKYSNWHNDGHIPQHVAELYAMPSTAPSVTLSDGTEHRLVLEGGSIDTNGEGVLITTEECLLSEVQQRNPGVSKQQLEQAFHQHLGIDQVLWLNRGCAGDDTHGHVDDITRFVGPNTILTALEPNTADENHLPLAENLERLRAARNRDGQPFQIRTLPMPAPVFFEGQRLPASYANFYIANNLVLVPTFNDPNDRVALNTLADCFPERTVTGIHCTDMIWGLGALHCLTQQEPARSKPTSGCNTFALDRWPSCKNSEEMPSTWPPSPDLHSLQELVAAADIEGFIAGGAPADEYETEAEQIFAQLKDWRTGDLQAERILPILEEVWAQNFSLGDPGLESRRVKLRALAGQIERFFGPGAQPQVRGA